ncbi:tetratricopeptide repeat protein [Dactylosporangium sp. CA-152071]|uniref:AfsR/SARP family transcriptional regulator n=1 Tax=Dactylosporangium sp. CA-152071 TaxID=3239933 RepID=UPI003D8E07DF
MEIRLLGPVELRLDHHVVDAGPPQQRHVLAVLAADAGRPVTTELLIDRVWDEAPSGARRTLQVYLTRLRRLLAPDGDAPVLPRRSGGYVLDVAPERIDLNRFRDLIDRARGRPDGEGVALLRRALNLWTGEPLAGVPGSWAERMRRAWRRQYVDALVQWAEAELRCGNAGTVLGPLTEAIGEYPLVEPLTAVLMRALHLTGRTVDALDCYADLRYRAAAVGRLLDHYVYCGQAAALRLEPHWIRLVADPPPAGVLVEPCACERRALAWFTEHRQAMLAAATLAAEAGFTRRAWQLARVLAGLLHNQGRWQDLIAVGRLAIEATERLGEHRERAWAQRFLGCAHAHLRRYGEAEAAYRAALDGYERLGDTAGRAGVHFALARLAESRGEWPLMRSHSASALRLYTEAGHRLGRGRALNLVGWVHARQREWADSLTHCRRALALQDELGDRSGQAATLDSIGYVHHHQGEYARALECYERALALCRRFGDRFSETKVLTHLGDTHLASGRPDAARAAWRVAGQILADLGDADAEQVRARLTTLTGVAG